jgi:hypothetical protein
LADLYREEIDAMAEPSVRRQLLLETHAMVAIRKGQMLRLTIAIFARNMGRAFHDFDLARARARGLAHARALDTSLNPVLASKDASENLRKLNRTYDLARALTRTHSYSRERALDIFSAHLRVLDMVPANDRKREYADLLVAVMKSRQPSLSSVPATIPVEWLLLPNASEQEYDACLAEMQQLRSAPDDWMRLQGVTTLLTLGAGSPKLFAEQSALIEKGIKHSQKFTFPAALHSETETPAFRAQLPDLFKLIFLHDPDDPQTHWLQPEFFDPSRPESKYFLSKPREFFILAADALDPKGETELGQWRRNIKDKG